MVSKEDCVHFSYIQKSEVTTDSMLAKMHKVSNCALNRMVLGGCREDCQWYETY